MSRYTRAMLADWLKDIILTFHSGTRELASDGGIVLLTSPEIALSPEYLYIGSTAIIREILMKLTMQANVAEPAADSMSLSSSFPSPASCSASSGALCLISAGSARSYTSRLYHAH